MTNKIVRIIAFYLPQYHPIPENDKWWGKGFTEWRNVAKAKPLFKSHYQPHIPADLGFYDLRVPETRNAQAEMAEKYGIEGFAYWHYWFSGKQILETPFNEVLDSQKPNFPFCLAWANETWSGIWHGLSEKILIKQDYPGSEDHINHFNTILPAFKDQRYIKVNNKPLFYIYRPKDIPNYKEFIKLWNKLARDNGLEGIYFIAPTSYPEKEAEELLKNGYDGIHSYRFHESLSKINKTNYLERIVKKLSKTLKLHSKTTLQIYDYDKFITNFVSEGDCNYSFFPTIYPSWDNSPRSGKRALIMVNSTPEKFKTHVKKVLNVVKKKPFDNRLIFLKSWNEWAEGNYMEPDLKFGLQYLEALNTEINSLDIND